MDVHLHVHKATIARHADDDELEWVRANGEKIEAYAAQVDESMPPIMLDHLLEAGLELDDSITLTVEEH
jgi:hypothetical protein